MCLCLQGPSAGPGHRSEAECRAPRRRVRGISSIIIISISIIMFMFMFMLIIIILQAGAWGDGAFRIADYTHAAKQTASRPARQPGSLAARKPGSLEKKEITVKLITVKIKTAIIIIITMIVQ